MARTESGNGVLCSSSETRFQLGRTRISLERLCLMSWAHCQIPWRKARAGELQEGNWHFFGEDEAASISLFDRISRIATLMEVGGARNVKTFDLGPESELRFEVGASSIQIEVRNRSK